MRKGRWNKLKASRHRKNRSIKISVKESENQLSQIKNAKYVQEQCEEIEKALVTGKTRQAYSLIKMLRSKFTSRINVIQGQDSKILQSQDEIIQQWTKYYSSLYRDHEESDSITRDIKKITPPSTEEPAEHLVRRRRRGHTHTKTK